VTRRTIRVIQGTREGAKALGLTVRHDLLALADEVIE
jgi:hypothetical protein